MLVCSQNWSVGRKGTLDSGRLEPEEDGGEDLHVRCEPMDFRVRTVDSTLSCDFGSD